MLKETLRLIFLSHEREYMCIPVGQFIHVRVLQNAQAVTVLTVSVITWLRIRTIWRYNAPTRRQRT